MKPDPAPLGTFNGEQVMTPRYWGKNIIIDGYWYTTERGRAAPKNPRPGDPAENFQEDVQLILKGLEKSSNAARTLIRAINSLPLILKIVPVAYRDYKIMKARPVNEILAYLPGSDSWACPPGPCTGGGSDSVIWFEPDCWRGADTDDDLDDLNDRGPDDVLIHEMFHAYRQMLGLFTTESMRDGYDWLEEFYAIVFENIYRSETGRTFTLRGDHALKHHRLSDLRGGAALVASDKLYYLTYQKEIDRLRWEPRMNSVIRVLSDPQYPKSVWNPLRVEVRKVEMPGQVLELSH
jgi:hypothetical protein